MKRLLLHFIVFAVRFDNLHPNQIAYIKVPALAGPLLGLMVSFHIMAPIVLRWHQTIKGMEFDLGQGAGGSFIGADLAPDGHFYHCVYLKDHKDARPKSCYLLVTVLICFLTISA